MANADALTTMGNAQLTVLHAESVAAKTTGLSNVEALGGGTVQLVTHPPREGHRIDNNGSAASKATKAGDMEEASRDLLQTRSQAKMNALTVTEFLPGPAHPPKVTGSGSGHEVVSIKADLLRPAHPPKTTGEQFINTFECDALTSNGNELYDPPRNQGKAYTDTDSDGKTEIITDITCKFKDKLIAIEVKVDPGSETNCIPLSHFRRLFPQLCSKDGNPKENALEPTLAQFEAYDGGILHSHGWIILPTWDIRDSKKFYPVRYYVVTREETRILISHATATWLELMKVLCPNKAPKIKRQVASVSKKAKEPSDQNNNNFLSGPQHPPIVKYTISTPQHPPKVKYTQTVMVKQQQDERPTLKQHSQGGDVTEANQFTGK